jgi:hypothetical protein
MTLPCIAVGLVSVLLAGCASTNQFAPIATGPIATNSARIVVSRDKGFVGCAAAMAIADNGKPIGNIGPGGQLVWDRMAGPVDLTALNTLEPSEAGRAMPLRFGVGGGMSYQFRVYFPFTGHRPKLELVSGIPVACEQNGTNTIAGKVEYVQQPSSTVGETKTIVGTIESRFIGPAHFKSGPPLWPCGMIVVAADNGEKSNFLIVGSGPNATSFYDTDGKAQGNLASGHAQVTVGKKVEVKYVIAPANYATKALAISVRYLD